MGIKLVPFHYLVKLPDEVRVIRRTSRRIKQVNKIRRCVLLTSCHFKKVKKNLFVFFKCDFRSFILQSGKQFEVSKSIKPCIEFSLPLQF